MGFLIVFADFKFFSTPPPNRHAFAICLISLQQLVFYSILLIGTGRAPPPLRLSKCTFPQFIPRNLRGAMMSLIGNRNSVGKRGQVSSHVACIGDAGLRFVVLKLDFFLQALWLCTCDTCPTELYAVAPHTKLSIDTSLPSVSMAPISSSIRTAVSILRSFGHSIVKSAARSLRNKSNKNLDDGHTNEDFFAMRRSTKCGTKCGKSNCVGKWSHVDVKISWERAIRRYRFVVWSFDSSLLIAWMHGKKMIVSEDFQGSRIFICKHTILKENCILVEVEIVFIIRWKPKWTKLFRPCLDWWQCAQIDYLPLFESNNISSKPSVFLLTLGDAEQHSLAPLCLCFLFTIKERYTSVPEERNIYLTHTVHCKRKIWFNIANIIQVSIHRAIHLVC